MSQYVTTPDGKRHSFPDEASPEQIKAALSSYVGPASAPADATGTADPYQSAGIRTRALEMLPTAGGFVGGVLGAFGGVPGSIGGAAAGGAIGEGLREGARGEQLSPGKIALGGVEQGAYQAAGGALAKGAGMAARPVMRRALGVGKTILKSFPDAVETTLKKGIPVNEKGALKATALRKESARELTKLLNTAKLGGKTFNTRDVTKHARELLRDPVLPTREKQRVLRDLVEFYQDKGLKIEPDVLQGIKKLYQDDARAIYRGAEGGRIAQSGLFAKKMAEGAREQLETLPGVAARNRETQSLIGAERAVKDAVMRPPGQFEFHRPGTYPALKNLYGSNVSSRLALTMADPKFQAMLRQSPRAAAQLIQQMMLSAESDATAVGQ